MMLIVVVVVVLMLDIGRFGNWRWRRRDHLAVQVDVLLVSND